MHKQFKPSIALAAGPRYFTRELSETAPFETRSEFLPYPKTFVAAFQSASNIRILSQLYTCFRCLWGSLSQLARLSPGAGRTVGYKPPALYTSPNA
jgi:hypothetical protein